MKYIYYTLIAIAISFFVAFTRGGYYTLLGINGGPLSILVGSIMFFTFTFVSLIKAKESRKSRFILLAILIGISLLELPMYIIDLNSTKVTLPGFLTRYPTILIAYGAFKIKPMSGKIILCLVWFVCVLWISFFGYKLWLNKLNFDSWTGKIEQTTSMPMEFQTYQGDTVSVDDYKEKYLVLDFWYTNCGICWAEFPNVEALYQKYKSHPKVELIGVHCRMEDKGETYSSGTEMLQEEGYTFPVLSTILKGATVKAAGVHVYPTIVIVDPQGTIVFRGSVESAAEYLDENLK